jgi:putative spermidine/putrescine transport system permease protein
MRLLARAAYLTLIVGIGLFLCLPTLVVAVTSFSASAAISFPPTGFSLSWYANFLTRLEFLRSLLLSLSLAIIVALTSVGLSTFVALEIGRGSPRLRRLVEAIALIPLILPTIVFASALLLLAGRLQLTSSFLPTLIVLGGAHLMISLPFTVRICMSAYAAMPAAYEEAANITGAGSLLIIWRIVLPSISSALLAGGLFAFLISFDEPVVSLFLSRQDLVTLPVQIQTYMRFRPDPTIAAISTVMSALSLTTVLAVDRLFGLARIFGLNR